MNLQDSDKNGSHWGTLKTAFFANLTIKSAAMKINMVFVAIMSQSYN